MIRNPLLVPDLRELIRAGETSALRDFFEDQHPAHVAELIEDLGDGEGDSALGLLADRTRAEVMSYVGPERQVRFVEGIPPGDAATLLHLMSHDDRAHLVNRLDDDHADEILRNLAQAERDDIRRLASYEPGTGGAVMTTDYATLPPGSTVKEALDRLRREAPDRETIDYSYVVDAADKLVGIVTHDDAMDILRQEQTEDILAFGGVAAGNEDDDEENYWQGKVQSSVRRRIGWLLLLFLGGSITRWVIHSFESVDKQFPNIEFDTFIPLLIGTGGNAGSQSVGTIIRGLALNQIQPSDTIRVVAREMLTGLVLGLLIGFLGYLYTWLWLGESTTFGLVIGFSILGICVWANGMGALVPLLARRFGADPALVSAPMISTLVDATGLVIFYTVAIILLIKLAPVVPS